MKFGVTLTDIIIRNVCHSKVLELLSSPSGQVSGSHYASAIVNFMCQLYWATGTQTFGQTFWVCL